MSDKYPLPSYAVSMWVTGDNLMVAFPSTFTEQGHTIKLPASAGGFTALLQIMRQRARSEDLRIGNAGTPTQWDVERLAAMSKALNEEGAARRAAKATERAEADALLREIGL